MDHFHKLPLRRFIPDEAQLKSAHGESLQKPGDGNLEAVLTSDRNARVLCNCELQPALRMLACGLAECAQRRGQDLDAVLL